jgi:protein FAM32A
MPPSEDYIPVVRGALKLKGGAPSGIKKKKKKPRNPANESSSSSKKSALQQALEDEDAATSTDLVKGKNKDDQEELDEEKLRELENRGNDGKTASERAYEDMRRRRVCSTLVVPRIETEDVLTYD